MVGNGSERAKDVRIRLADESEKKIVEAKSTVEGTRLEDASMTDGGNRGNGDVAKALGRRDRMEVAGLAVEGGRKVGLVEAGGGAIYLWAYRTCGLYIDHEDFLFRQTSKAKDRTSTPGLCFVCSLLEHWYDCLCALSTVAFLAYGADNDIQDEWSWYPIDGIQHLRSASISK